MTHRVVTHDPRLTSCRVDPGDRQGRHATTLTIELRTAPHAACADLDPTIVDSEIDLLCDTLTIEQVGGIICRHWGVNTLTIAEIPDPNYLEAALDDKTRGFLDEIQQMPHCPTCGWVICDCCDACGLPTEYARGLRGETCDCGDPLLEDPR